MRKWSNSFGHFDHFLKSLVKKAKFKQQHTHITHIWRSESERTQFKAVSFFQCSLKFRFQTQNKCCYFVSHGKSTIETTCPYWKIEKFYSWQIKSSNIPYNIRPIFLISLVYLYLLIYVGLALLGSNVPMEVIWTCIYCVFFFYSE